MIKTRKSTHTPPAKHTSEQDRWAKATKAVHDMQMQKQLQTAKYPPGTVRKKNKRGCLMIIVGSFFEKNGDNRIT